MRFALLVILASTSGVVAVAQHPDAPPLGAVLHADLDVYDSEAWQKVSFVERRAKFGREERDSEWAPTMERAIKEKVAEFDRPLKEVFGEEKCSGIPLCQETMPSVQLMSVECRWTLCKIEMRWPPDTFRSVVGVQVSFLYGLGIDHQGETYGLDDGNQYLVELIARRRT